MNLKCTSPRHAFLAIAAILTLSLAACGGDDDDADASPTAAATSAASPDATVSRNPTPTAEETEWMTALCALETKSDTDQEALPGANQDTSTLTLEQRKARASILWPAQGDIEDAFVTGMRALTPPASGAAIHAAITSHGESTSTEVRRSFANIDTIFASVEAVEANNDVLDAAEQAANAAVDEAFDAAPALTDLYESTPGCERRNPPTE